jgi:hypothetical protein
MYFVPCYLDRYEFLPSSITGGIQRKQIIQASGSNPDQMHVFRSDSSSTTQQGEGLTPEEIALISEEFQLNIDPGLESTELEIWEDMRAASRRVVRLAEKMESPSQEQQANQKYSNQDAPPPNPYTGTRNGQASQNPSVRSDSSVSSKSVVSPESTTTYKWHEDTTPKPTLVLVDGNGRKFLLPYEECKSWEVMPPTN